MLIYNRHIFSLFFRFTYITVTCPRLLVSLQPAALKNNKTGCTSMHVLLGFLVVEY